MTEDEMIGDDIIDSMDMSLRKLQYILEVNVTLISNLENTVRKLHDNNPDKYGGKLFNKILANQLNSTLEGLTP